MQTNPTPRLAMPDSGRNNSRIFMFLGFTRDTPRLQDVEIVGGAVSPERGQQGVVANGYGYYE